MVKGTPAMGKKRRKGRLHIKCRRCGKNSYHKIRGICSSCGYEFEVFQSMTDKKMRKCPKCKEFKLNRLIGAGSSIIFKGSGFYETDYKGKSSKQTAKKDTSQAPCATCPHSGSKGSDNSCALKDN